MLDTIVAWDQALFCYLHKLRAVWMNDFWWWASDKYVFIPLYILFALLLVKRYGKQAWMPMLIIGAGVGASDFVASGILKPWVGRLRPCNEPDLVCTVDILRGYCSGAPSFASSHAANSMCLAMASVLWLGKSFRWFAIVMLIYCFLHSYSRIYLGVHYPLDLLAGATIGLGFAFIGYRLVIGRLHTRKMLT